MSKNLDGPKLYHEKQQKELCALHALNNLMQKSNAFTKCELDILCRKLTPNRVWNPHCSFLGLGNYDINVIMVALQNKGYESVWFDKRKNIQDLNLPNILGFIINVPSNVKIGSLSLPFHRRHWICLRRVGDLFYNLDSKLQNPDPISSTETDFKAYLRNQLACPDKFMLIIPAHDKTYLDIWVL